MFLFQLLADVSTDSFPGGAGWATSGLVTMVLGWLLFRHIPNREKRDAEMHEAKDKHFHSILDAKDNQAKYQQDVFVQALASVTAHCEREVSAVTESFRRESDRLMSVLNQISAKIDGTKPKRGEQA